MKKTMIAIVGLSMFVGLPTDAGDEVLYTMSPVIRPNVMLFIPDHPNLFRRAYPTNANSTGSLWTSYYSTGDGTTGCRQRGYWDGDDHYKSNCQDINFANRDSDDPDDVLLSRVPNYVDCTVAAGAGCPAKCKGSCPSYYLGVPMYYLTNSGNTNRYLAENYLPFRLEDCFSDPSTSHKWPDEVGWWTNFKASFWTVSQFPGLRWNYSVGDSNLMHTARTVYVANGDSGGEGCDENWNTYRPAFCNIGLEQSFRNNDDNYKKFSSIITHNGTAHDCSTQLTYTEYNQSYDYFIPFSHYQTVKTSACSYCYNGDCSDNNCYPPDCTPGTCLLSPYDYAIGYWSKTNEPNTTDYVRRSTNELYQYSTSILTALQAILSHESPRDKVNDFSGRAPMNTGTLRLLSNNNYGSKYRFGLARSTLVGASDWKGHDEATGGNGCISIPITNQTCMYDNNYWGVNYSGNSTYKEGADGAICTTATDDRKRIPTAYGIDHMFHWINALGANITTKAAAGIHGGIALGGYRDYRSVFCDISAYFQYTNPSYTLHCFGKAYTNPSIQRFGIPAAYSASMGTFSTTYPVWADNIAANQNINANTFLLALLFNDPRIGRDRATAGSVFTNDPTWYEPLQTMKSTDQRTDLVGKQTVTTDIISVYAKGYHPTTGVAIDMRSNYEKTARTVNGKYFDLADFPEPASWDQETANAAIAGFGCSLTASKAACWQGLAKAYTSLLNSYQSRNVNTNLSLYSTNTAIDLDLYNQHKCDRNNLIVTYFKPTTGPMYEGHVLVIPYGGQVLGTDATEAICRLPDTISPSGLTTIDLGTSLAASTSTRTLYHDNGSAIGTPITCTTGDITDYDDDPANRTANDNARFDNALCLGVDGYWNGSSSLSKWRVGDSIHSQPVVVGRPNPYYSNMTITYSNLDKQAVNTTYQTFANGAAKSRKKMLYLTTNEGILHAFHIGQYQAATTTDTEFYKSRESDGTPVAMPELWAYMPYEKYVDAASGTSKYLLTTNLQNKFDIAGSSGVTAVPNLSALKNYMHRPWGFDGSPVVADVNLSGSTWTTMLVAGLGMGGRVYNALNVTNPDSPLFVRRYYRIGNGSGFLYHMGNATSDPVIGKIRKATVDVNGVVTGATNYWIMAIGGGYYNTSDPTYASYSTTGNTQYGRGFYLVDLNSRTLVKSYEFKCPYVGEFATLTDAQVAALHCTDTPAMKYAFAGPARGVDTNGDSFIDLFYIADLGGQIWKLDISNPIEDNWKFQMVFQATQPGATYGPNKGWSPFWSAPAIARNAFGQDYILIGSGDRTNILNRGSGDKGKMFSIMDVNLQISTVTRHEADLATVTRYTSLANRAFNANGWVIPLEDGEKVFSPPAVIGRYALYMSFKPYPERGCTTTYTDNGAGGSTANAAWPAGFTYGGVTYPNCSGNATTGTYNKFVLERTVVGESFYNDIDFMTGYDISTGKTSYGLPSAPKLSYRAANATHPSGAVDLLITSSTGEVANYTGLQTESSIGSAMAPVKRVVFWRETM